MELTDQLSRSNLRTRIKVCGITRLEDALDAIAFGADALGFVFYEKSPRFIQPENAAEIIRNLPPFVITVGLFVNPSQEYINDTLKKCAIDVIQLHGNETPEFCMDQTRRVIKALAVESAADLKHVKNYHCSVLLDAKAPKGVFGGSGDSFDWSLLQGLEHHYPLIIAGGLNEGNLNEALSLRDWFAVDVSSGVEQLKGIKDKEKMFRFCKLVHQFRSKV